MSVERVGWKQGRQAGAIVVLFVALAAGACRGPVGSGPSAPRPAPDFSLEDVTGNTVRLSDSSGRVRLVDFWATWCPPCREEIPHFKELHRGYGDKGLTILAISMDDDAKKVLPPFLEKWEIPYTTLIGNDEVAEAFGGVFGLPTTFLVDRDGQILETWIGGTPKGVVEEKLRAALGLETAG